MKSGDSVTRLKVLKHKNPKGKVTRVTKDYVIVEWDNIPGVWHYTLLQSKNLTIITEEN